MDKKKSGKKVFSQRGTSFLTLSSSYTNQLNFKETQSLKENEVNNQNPQDIEQSNEITDSSSNYNDTENLNNEESNNLTQETVAEEISNYEESTITKKSSIISTKIYSLRKESAKEAEDATEELKRIAKGEDKPNPKNIASNVKKKKVTKKIKKTKTEPKESNVDDKIVEIAEKVTTVMEKAEDIKEHFFTPLLRLKDTILNVVYDKLENLNILKDKVINLFKPIIDRIIEPFIFIINYINKKKAPVVEEEEIEEEEVVEEKKNVSFLELAEKNIIFTDNKKQPLYTLEQLRGKTGYTASEEVLRPLIFENIINAFKEVAPKAKVIPTPQTGKYAGIPVSEIMENITEEEIIVFLNYVMKYPRGYIGKNYRITESFAGWVVSGTPED